MHRFQKRATAAALGLGALALLALPTDTHARPWAGFTMASAPGGVRVRRVLPSSPAAKARLRAGDVIFQVNGQAVGKPMQIIAITRRTRVGRALKLKLKRRGRTLVKWLKLVKAPKPAQLLRLYWLNQRAPNFTAPLINRAGKKSLSALRGKPVILYFWASWCDSCKLNFPKLKRLYATYKGNGLVIYSFSQDKRASKTKKTLKLLSLPFLVGHNYKNRVGRKFNSNKIPTLIAIDKKGYVRDLVRGSSFGYGRLKNIWFKINR